LENVWWYQRAFVSLPFPLTLNLNPKMEQMTYKLYSYKGTPEEDKVQEERVKKIERLEKTLEELKKESRIYVYKSEQGRV
jgi:hypothetical protein